MNVSPIRLPRDGAAYKCTFSRDGAECRKVTTEGLAMSDYEALLSARPPGVHFMRALCRDHIAEVSTFA